MKSIWPIAWAIGFRAFLFWVVLFGGWVLQARPAELGSPIIRNFSSKDYGGANQVWSCVAGPRGFMYFAANDGIHEYNGVSWKRYSLKGNVRAQSLAVDSKGRLYYGGAGDFGYFGEDAAGKTVLCSLLDQVNEKDRAFYTIPRIIITSQGVYFLASERIYRYSGGKVSAINGHADHPQACVIGDTIFYNDFDRGVCQLDGDAMYPVPGMWRNKKGMPPMGALLGLGGHELLLAWHEGPFQILDLKPYVDEATGRYQVAKGPQKPLLRKASFPVEKILKSQEVFFYGISKMDENTYVSTTIRNGLVIFDQKGELVRVVNKRNGLIDNTTFDALPDRRGNLWVCTNSGISYVETGGAISQYSELLGVEGIALSCFRGSESFYVGGFQTLKKLEYFEQGGYHAFTPVPGAPIEIWDAVEVDGELLIGSSEGLYRIRNGKIDSVQKKVIAYSLGRSRKFKDVVFLGSNDGLVLFQRDQKNPSGWKLIGRMDGINDPVRAIREDSKGDLYLATEYKGLIRIHFQKHFSSGHKIYRYGLEHGLPRLDWPVPCPFEEGLLVGTEVGFHKAVGLDGDPEKVRFVRDERFNGSTTPGKMGVTFAARSPRGDIWVNTAEGVICFRRKEGGNYVLDTLTCRKIDKGQYGIYFDQNGVIWVAGEGVYRLDESSSSMRESDFYTIISRVEVNRKRAVFEGDAGTISVDREKGVASSVPFSENTLSFHYGAIWHEAPGRTRYQFMLQGFDKAWSDWTSDTKKDYTNLPEGSYRFLVKAKNVYDVEGSIAEYKIQILPPWYRTWWAYVIWFLISSFLVWTLFKLYSLKLRRQNLYLEKLVEQRTLELKEVTLTDPLTGLRNRRYIAEILSEDIQSFVGLKTHVLDSSNKRKRVDSEETVFGVYTIDIDYFKKVNDTYGHEAGDLVLKQFSGLLRSLVRKDDAVIRVGGEEFLVVLKRTRPEYLHFFPQKVLDSVSTWDFKIGDGQILKKTCSMGYAAFPFHPEHPSLLTFEQVMGIADRGLYFAKEHGRNQAVWIKPGASESVSLESLPLLTGPLEQAMDAALLDIGEIYQGYQNPGQG